MPDVPRSDWRAVIRQPGLLIALLTLALLAAYGLARSASPDDFDSYSFLLALDHFDIALQQPQPPGFPVYVAAGHLVNLLIAEPLAALTALSALTGALAALMLGWLAHLQQRRVEVTLAVMAIFGLSPIVWLNAGKALSDVPGLALSLAALATLWAARHKRRWLLPGLALLGLSLGTRPQANIPGLLLAAWLAWDLLRLRDWRRLVGGGVTLLAATLLWLIPTAHLSGGLAEYRALIDAHSDHVWRSDSLFGMGPLSATTLTARLKDFVETFTMPMLGISVYAPLGPAQIVALGLLALWTVVGLAAADYRRADNRAALVWLLVALVPYVLLTSLNRPRLMLPVLAPFVLLTTIGWARLLASRTWPRRGLWLAVSLTLLAQGLPLAQTLRSVPAPPEQAAADIRAAYDPADTLIAAAGSFRALQVELPEYTLLYRYRFDAERARTAVASGQYQQILIVDRDDFDAAMLAVLDGDGLYVPTADRIYARDPRVHWQHSQLRVQTLRPAAEVGAADLHLPTSGQIDVANLDDSRFLGRGWFRPETPGGVAARWAGEDQTSVVRVALPATDQRLTFRAAAFPAQQTVTVIVNGQPFDQLALSQDWAEYVVMIPAGVLVAGDIAHIELRHDRLESPFEASGGTSSDQRQLTAAYAWLRFDAQ